MTTTPKFLIRSQNNGAPKLVLRDNKLLVVNSPDGDTSCCCSVCQPGCHCFGMSGQSQLLGEHFCSTFHLFPDVNTFEPLMVEQFNAIREWIGRQGFTVQPTGGSNAIASRISSPHDLASELGCNYACGMELPRESPEDPIICIHDPQYPIPILTRLNTIEVIYSCCGELVEKTVEEYNADPAPDTWTINWWVGPTHYRCES